MLTVETSNLEVRLEGTTFESASAQLSASGATYLFLIPILPSVRASLDRFEVTEASLLRRCYSPSDTSRTVKRQDFSPSRALVSRSSNVAFVAT